MMNSAMELHDSDIDKIELEGSDVVVFFSYAYIHQSKGRPGIDAGDGWSQSAKLTIRNSTLPPVLPDNLSDLRGGYLKVENEFFMNLIPVPLNRTGETEVAIHCSEGEEITFTGDGMILSVVDEGEYIEGFFPHS